MSAKQAATPYLWAVRKKVDGQGRTVFEIMIDRLYSEFKYMH